MELGVVVSFQRRTHLGGVVQHNDVSADLTSAKKQLEELNNEMDVTLRLLGIVMDNWSQADAETVWLSWYEELSAKEIQAHLDISQPAVSKRKSSARLDEIQLLIKRYQYLIQHL